MFREFDKDGSGSISIDEARAMLRKLDIPDEEVSLLTAREVILFMPYKAT